MIRTANLTGSVSRQAGGLLEGVCRLVQSLENTGVEARVFGSADRFTAEDIAAWQPVVVSAFPPIGSAKFGYSPRLMRALVDYEPDLVHTHGLWLYSSMATHHYWQRKRAPYVISPHGMLDSWAVRNSRWKKRLAGWLYENAHLRDAACIRALCESEARSIRAYGLRNPICVIPNGIDFPAEGGQTEVRGQWSVVGSLKAEGRKVLLYLGRIHPKKGLINLLKAWKSVVRSPVVSGQRSAVSRQSSDWVLAIAGWDQGGHEAELKKLASELGIQWTDTSDQRLEVSGQHSVVFLGPQFGEAKAACYRNCDAFVLPSFSEGLPMVVLEAWAHGKPVLMTPECNLPEGFSADAAIRIEPSAESIVQGLGTLFQSSSSDLQSAGSRGHALVADRFAWPRIAADMKSVYDWMLSGGSPPACVRMD